MFLPRYSPVFNPVENAFSKLKALMRAKAERTITALWNAVGSLVDLFTPAECQNYFNPQAMTRIKPDALIEHSAFRWPRSPHPGPAARCPWTALALSSGGMTLGA
ncbi:hypothetical protein BQ8794_240206 [Mesorhizobium prunaredense]|uniref:Tc1-like transposase DDE domain-containing protein n=1 Tax=Mesorhizobium prunaredense TaxID=1631249 RepID=A0A1R3VB32_9HYPH|nr:hypothetical protein BQ8794_240206 [Mesorhizobium prunaredense]